MAAKKTTTTKERKVRTGGPKRIIKGKAAAKTKGKVRVVRVVGGKVTRKRIKAPPAQEAKRLVKRAEWSEKRAVRFAKNAEKLREKATKVAAKALAKPKCRYSPKMQAALEEIARLGQEAALDAAEALHAVSEVQEEAMPEDEALKVVSDVLKGSFK
jgi:hypothetical protein